MSNPDQSPAVDERAAFIRWLCESFPAAWTERSAAHAWDNNESAVSAWHSAREPLLDAIAELKSCLAPTEAAAMAATVPAGWKPAPHQATAHMVEEGCRAWRANAGMPLSTQIAVAYGRMLIVAPQAPVADQPAEPSPAARDVLAERARQINAEGWTTEHDDEHDLGQLARAGAAYAAQSLCAEDAELKCGPPSWWPWERAWWKPNSRRGMLVKAGALILAEIERLDRAAPKGDSNG